jgi:hypothetical protein
MSGSDEPEVAVVERGELRLVEPLDDRHHGCVDEPDVRVRVPIAQVTYAPIVLLQQVLDQGGRRRVRLPWPLDAKG